MATLVSMSDLEDQKLLTAEEFLDWLKPGVFADLVNGESVMHSPLSPALNPENLPEVSRCLAEISGEA